MVEVLDFFTFFIFICLFNNSFSFQLRSEFFKSIYARLDTIDVISVTNYTTNGSKRSFAFPFALFYFKDVLIDLAEGGNASQFLNRQFYSIGLLYLVLCCKSFV